MINFNKKYLTTAILICVFLVLGFLIILGQRTLTNKNNLASVQGVADQGAQDAVDYVRVDGECGEPENECKKGKENIEVLDTSENYNWSCSGSRGGKTAYCSYPKKGAKCGAAKGGCERGQASRVSSSFGPDGCPIWEWKCSTEDPETRRFCEANRTQFFPFVSGCW